MQEGHTAIYGMELNARCKFWFFSSDLPQFRALGAICKRAPALIRSGTIYRQLT
jgi:hypothetical protein